MQYEASGPFPDFRYCHCERCQKATGSAHSAMLWVGKDQVRWLAGEDNVTVFRAPNADDYPRGFCKTCGGMVPRLARDGKHMIIPAGTLDTDPGVRPNKNIFWRLKAKWYDGTEKLPKFDERP